MSTNPYQPPEAAVGDVAPSMEPAPPRPRAAVFTIIMGWVVLALSTYAVIRYAWYFALSWKYLSRVQSIWMDIALRAAMVAYLILMVIAIQKRWKIGRWSGSLFILALIALPLMAIKKAPPFGSGQLGELVGYMLGLSLCVLPLVYWLYAFAFSRKARTWFNWVPGTDAPR